MTTYEDTNEIKTYTIIADFANFDIDLAIICLEGMATVKEVDDMPINEFTPAWKCRYLNSDREVAVVFDVQADTENAARCLIEEDLRQTLSGDEE